MKPPNLSAVSLALALAIALPQPAPAQGAACRADQMTPSALKVLTDSLMRASADRSANSPSPESVTAASVGVELDSGCAVAGTLSWNNGFDGGIVIYQRSGPGITVLAAAAYPGAKRPLSAGRGHVALTYSAGRGSGQLAERTVVLCALALDNWVPCVDVLTRQEIAASGYPPADSLAAGMRLMIESAVKTIGDTLVVESDVRMKRHGRDPEKHRIIISRIVIP